MRIKTDPVSGAFYIHIRDGQPFEALDLGPGAYVHIDENGNVLELEFLSLEEFAELTAGGLEIPNRIEEPAKWEVLPFGRPHHLLSSNPNNPKNRAGSR